MTLALPLSKTVSHKRNVLSGHKTEDDYAEAAPALSYSSLAVISVDDAATVRDGATKTARRFALHLQEKFGDDLW